MSSTESKPTSTSTDITPANRIEALSAINEDIPRLLSAAGAAINALTNRPLPAASTPPSSPSVSTSLAAHKAAFTTSTRSYFTLAKSISARLFTQAKALEDAGIIPPEAPRPGEAGYAGEGTTNGGLGNLDVGWLNSRTGDVGSGMEAELVKQLREMLEREVEANTKEKGEEVKMEGAEE